MSLSLVNIKDKKITVNVGFFIFYFQSLDGYSLEKYIFFLRYFILKGKAVVRVILLSLCSRNALKFCCGVDLVGDLGVLVERTFYSYAN